MLHQTRKNRGAAPSRPYQWKMQGRKVSLLLLLLPHLAAGWIWRKEYIYYPHKTSPWNSTQGCRQVSAACGCRPEAGELLLAAWLTEKQVLPSDIPAEHRAVFASCNVSERWGWAGKCCSEWLLHRLLLASWYYALRFYFYHYFVKPAGNSLFPLFPQASLGAYCVKSESIGSDQSYSFWPSKLQTHWLWGIIFKLPVKI